MIAIQFFHLISCRLNIQFTRFSESNTIRFIQFIEVGSLKENGAFLNWLREGGLREEGLSRDFTVNVEFQILSKSRSLTHMIVYDSKYKHFCPSDSSFYMLGLLQAKVLCTDILCLLCDKKKQTQNTNDALLIYSHI